jgi:hypothetical protein
MQTTNGRARHVGPVIGLGAVAIAAVLLAAPARADEGKTQDVDAGGLTFQAPAEWKATTPSSTMRKAQMKIEPAQGDDAPAELVVFAFPGGAGSVDANIERWQKQFRDKDGNAPKADVKSVKGKNCEVTRVEIAGHYLPPSFPGQAQAPEIEKARLLGAIVITEQTGYFLRLVGPEKTVSAAKASFDKMLSTMSVAGK